VWEWQEAEEGASATHGRYDKVIKYPELRQRREDNFKWVSKDMHSL
jgi:hypothetical protein